MKKICNLIANKEYLKEWCNADKIEKFCVDCDVDGYEIICAGDFAEEIPENRVIGVHLPFFNSWMDLYNKNYAALDMEYGNRKVWQQFYGGDNFDCIYNMLEQQMDFAQKLNAKYVVLHVCEIGTTETLTGRHKYSHKEIILAVCNIVNKLTRGKNYSFYILLENLWWQGFTFTDVKMTEFMLNNIDYKNKGIMLDIGHLMNTNKDISNWDEAADYIIKNVNNHKNVIDFVKGVHLHGTLEGNFAKEFYKNKVHIEQDYYKRFKQSYDYVLRVDAHKPFASNRVKEIIDAINPEFMVYEFAADDMEKKLEMNLLQNSYFTDKKI